MRRGDQAHVGANRLRAPQPLELARLDHAQQLDLRRQVELADLVEKERAPLGKLEAPFLRRVRAGERALLIAEQLRFDEALGQRRAADLDERPLRPQRVVMDGLRDQLLAGARLAADEHGRVGPRDLRDLLVDQPHRTARAEDVREIVALAQLALEVRVFLAQPLALGVDDALNADRLRHQRRDDAKELHRAVEIALGFETEVGAERADGLPVQQNRDADVADLLAPQLRTIGGAPQEHRLARHFRHDDRLAALHDAAGDPFAEPELRVDFPARRPFSRHDLDVAVGAPAARRCCGRCCDDGRECRAPDAGRSSDSRPPQVSD